MKKVAVFGKTGSGKSTLGKALSETKGITLHQLASIVYQANGKPIDRQSFDGIHDNILNSEQWVIDGLGPLASFRKRLDEADTLVYIDLPYPVCYWFVTKRLLKSLFVKPEGWPEGSSVFKGTRESYKMLKLSPSFWNDEFTQSLNKMAKHKTIHILRSTNELEFFIQQLSKSKE